MLHEEPPQEKPVQAQFCYATKHKWALDYHLVMPGLLLGCKNKYAN